MKNLKNLKYVMALLAVSLVAAACGGGDGNGELGLVTADTLTICTDVPYPPMEYEDPDAEGGYTGFDIELMRVIAADLGLGLSVATPGWDAITSGLAMEADDCDISAASITITAEREENVDFSTSYFTADQSLLVTADGGIGGQGDLTGVALQSGTTGELWAIDNLPADVLVSFEAAGDLYLALEAGQVDGVITDLVGNQGYIDDNPGLFKIAETYQTDEEYGFAVQEEGSEKLLEAVNDSLKKLQDDGTYDEIFAAWFDS